MNHMHRGGGRIDCETVQANLDPFIRGTLNRTRRVLGNGISTHLETCLRCATALSSRLVEIERSEADATAADDRIGAASRPSPRGVPRTLESEPRRRWFAVMMRSRATDYRELQLRVGRIVARRAFRFVAAQEGRGIEAATCAAEEIVDATAAVVRLGELARELDADHAAAIAEFSSWLADVEHVEESFEKLRSSGLLLPRPPALPAPGDWRCRERLLAWAATLLRGSLSR